MPVNGRRGDHTDIRVLENIRGCLHQKGTKCEKQQINQKKTEKLAYPAVVEYLSYPLGGCLLAFYFFEK